MAPSRNTRPAKVYGFHSFAEPGFPSAFPGAFRDNIQCFLHQFAEPVDSQLEGMTVWCTHLVSETKGLEVVPLYTVEENVELSRSPVCDQCRFAGWSNHFVSRRRYHFIIPGDDWNGDLVDGSFDLQTHLLHGLIHCNGFGHLICINGIEGGSKDISGREIMDLWDRICTSLHARKISVEDLSKKRNMDLRLLHGVAYGNSWFGRWGYRFCHGSFGVKAHNYEAAVDALGSTDLDGVEIADESIREVIRHYRGRSGACLVTMRDLFGLLLSLKPMAAVEAAPPPALESKSSLRKTRKFSSLAAHLDSRWPAKRLENVAQVIVDALKLENRRRRRGMTRQAVRDAARLHIGDTGLIDHVLKVMNNVVVGNSVVRRAVNRSTKVLEYTIQEVRGGKELRSGTRNVLNDLSHLYQNLLIGFPDAQIVLHSKHFVKEWPFRDEDDDLLRFIFKLSCSDGSVPVLPTRDCVAIPLYSTIGDLKFAVQRAIQETYCGMDNIWVADIVGMEEMADSEVVFGVCESGKEIVVRALGLDVVMLLESEGEEKWTVKCRCGAGDDDGERMVACDICGTWQHTRCCGIDDSEAVPRLFVCEYCCCTALAPNPSRDFLVPYFADFCSSGVWGTPGV